MRTRNSPPSSSGAEPSNVLVDGRLVIGPAVRAGVAVGADDDGGVAVAPGVALGDGDAAVAVITEVTVALHRTNEPPPFAEPLH